ncbi:MAG: hypothetical protein M1821_001322 [Bathelium mastoideum]|nr:MAG: hypothetical protein M1821_001322 [Bathelium mastoideum]
MVFGLALALPIATSTGIATVTGVAEGVHHQKQQNREAANAHRMAKFYVDVFCAGADAGADKSKSSSSSSSSSKKKDSASARAIDGGMLVLRDDKAWIAGEVDGETGLPAGEEARSHPCAAFYLSYPSEMAPHPRGLVSTIARDPPMLNWLYIDAETLELRYGNRTKSMAHLVGDWDWTDENVEAGAEEAAAKKNNAGWVMETKDAKSGKGQWKRDEKEDGPKGKDECPGAGLTLEGWEGFCAVWEEAREVEYEVELDLGKGAGMQKYTVAKTVRPGWAVYYDRNRDGLRNLKKQGKTVLEISLERRMLPEEEQKKGEDDDDDKPKMNMSGGVKTTQEK